jgi:hypothetical protein
LKSTYFYYPFLNTVITNTQLLQFVVLILSDGITNAVMPVCVVVETKADSFAVFLETDPIRVNNPSNSIMPQS